MRQMRDSGIDILTLGQYLRPTERHLSVTLTLTLTLTLT
jgi:lipoate synthase